MTQELKKQIGGRVREMRERTGYTREQLGELCSLSSRFIANVEFGDAAFSLDSLMVISRVLSCSCDYLLFGINNSSGEWKDITSKIERLDIQYKEQVEKVFHGFVEAIIKAENA